MDITETHTHCTILYKQRILIPTTKGRIYERLAAHLLLSYPNATPFF